MKKLVDRARATAFRKGVLGTSSNWLTVWTTISVARFVKRRLGKREVVVERIVLAPGEAVEIRDTSITWGELKKRR